MRLAICAGLVTMTGILLIVVKLFQEEHFYSAALLLVGVGSAALIVALFLYMKDTK